MSKAPPTLGLLVCLLPGCGDDGEATESDDTSGGVAETGSADGSTSTGSGSGGLDSSTGPSGETTDGSGSSGDPPPFDGDLSCAGDPFPDRGVPDPVTVGGPVIDDFAPIPGATVEALSVEDDSVLATAVSDGNGDYLLEIPTGGVPTRVYFHITAPGAVETYRYYGYPLTDHVDSGQRVWSTMEAEVYAAATGVEPTAGTGVLRVNPRDCDLQVTGVGTVALVDPAPPILMYEGGADCNYADAELTAASECGFAMAYDVPPEMVTVDAAISDVEFYVQNVVVAADAMTWVTVQPDRP